MRANNQKFFYTLTNPEFFDTLDRYKPNADTFYQSARDLLPVEWQITRNGIWFNCIPPDLKVASQGWKIHLSATPTNAKDILLQTAQLLVKRHTSFKFLLDQNIFYITNSKRWPRGSAGKFITVYPRNMNEFFELLDQFRETFVGLEGPYILSDRRYKDSRVVHYRYGGIVPLSRVNITGGQDYILRSPSGQEVPDERLPYFSPPDWVSDPFPAPNFDGEKSTLKDGRYSVESVLSFANSGGVYFAIDNLTTKRVVVKEARPFTGFYSSGENATSMLRKEHRLLKKLADTNITPSAVDFFQDWEHFFLIEEYIDGATLRLFASEMMVTIRIKPTIEEVAEFCAKFRLLYSAIARALSTLHNLNVVYSDLSLYNIIVLDEGASIKMIDLEAAYEPGVDRAVSLFTPGFASAGRLKGARYAQFEDDAYGLGALMLAALMPINAMCILDPEVHKRYLESCMSDFGLSPSLTKCISGLLDSDPAKRLKPSDASTLLAEDLDSSIKEPRLNEHIGEERIPYVPQKSIVEYILNVASYDRRDRLFPSDSALFETNALSVAFGACGVAYAINAICKGIPRRVLDWILSHSIGADTYPPGLYIGLSGIAWVLLELGFRSEAIDIADASSRHSLLYEEPDLFYGVAGWGLTQLKFFLATQDERFLANATQAGKHLVQSRKEDLSGCWWPCMGAVYFGFAHGASGVSLFLLYLYLVTGKEEFLDVGRRGLDFDLSKGLRTKDGGLTWKMSDAPVSATVPYWRYGTAGIGMVVLRYHRVVNEQRYRTILKQIIVDADRKYTIFPGRFFGLAGLGEFFLDLLELNDECPTALESAWKVASGILLFKLDRNEGVAFPGEELMRISCDYGTGSAGIALFFHRLATRSEAPFMLDQTLRTSKKDKTCPQNHHTLAI